MCAVECSLRAMVLGWLTERRRRRIEERPFPAEWEAALERNVGHWQLLSEEERALLKKLVLVFVEEKTWVGAHGLELDDEIRVTIAGEACLLLLGRDHSLYADVDSIVVYPSTMLAPERPRSFFDRRVEPVETPRHLLGEAHRGGPVLLAWDAVKRGARDPKDGRNVVIHELAHKIDMLDARADGTPPLESRAALRKWAEVAAPVFLELRARAEKGKKTFLDPYGATDEAEFFAVATELFFEKPARFEREHPELYELLREYYGQDPAARERSAAASE